MWLEAISSPTVRPYVLYFFSFSAQCWSVRMSFILQFFSAVGHFGVFSRLKSLLECFSRAKKLPTIFFTVFFAGRSNYNLL